MTKKHNKKNEKTEQETPEMGDNFKAGREEVGPLPNNPAENAEKKSPEEEKDADDSDN